MTMKYLKIFEAFHKPHNSSEDELDTFLPSEDELKMLIDTRLLNLSFRQACQKVGIPQLVAAKLVSDKYDIADNNIALLSGLTAVLYYEKTPEGLKQLQKIIGSDKMKDIHNAIEKEKIRDGDNHQDLHKKHAIMTSLTLDIQLAYSTMKPPKGVEFNFLHCKVESKTSIFYDDAEFSVASVEKELNLKEDEAPTKNDIVELIINTLIKLNYETSSKLLDKENE